MNPGNWPTGYTRFACLVGDPASHSLSPTLFNAGFSHLGLDWVYLAMSVTPDNLPSAIAGLRALGVGGISVTMPHKKEIIDLLDGLTSTASTLTSVNVVYVESGELIGDSTDGRALVDNLSFDHGIDLVGKRVALVGTGAVARSISVSLVQAKVGKLSIHGRNRSAAKEIHLLASLGGFSTQVVLGEATDIEEAEIVINGTSLGMAGRGHEGSSPVDKGLLHSGQFLCDVVYHPLETRFLQYAKEIGAPHTNGVGMLTRIAVLAFERWSGELAPVEEMRRAVTAEVERRIST